VVPVTTVRAAGALSRSSKAAYHELADRRGGVLLRLDTGAYHGVDAVGALVWSLLEGAPTFEELLPLVSGTLDEVPTGFDVEVEQFLAGLRDRGLIEVSETGTP
jgi:hypothetical protein